MSEGWKDRGDMLRGMGFLIHVAMEKGEWGKVAQLKAERDVFDAQYDSVEVDHDTLRRSIILGRSPHLLDHGNLYEGPPPGKPVELDHGTLFQGSPGPRRVELDHGFMDAKPPKPPFPHQ